MFSTGQFAPSPVERSRDVLWDKRDITLFIKRDDLLHIGGCTGNKVRKLRENLVRAASLEKNILITMGGAFSNHLHAVASIGDHFGFNTVGLVRGEEDPDNPTIQYLRAKGMELHFLSRIDYRERYSSRFTQKWKRKYPGAYWIPEGGTNNVALVGVKNLVQEILHQTEYTPDLWVVPVGTGGTLAGVSKALPDHCKVVGVVVGKGKKYLTSVYKTIAELTQAQNWTLEANYHFGGFGTYSIKLIAFIEYFYRTHQILLDPIYTGKMMFGLYEMINDGRISPGSSVVAIHTGGLQGWQGYRYKYSDGLIPPATASVLQDISSTSQ